MPHNDRCDGSYGSFTLSESEFYSLLSAAPQRGYQIESYVNPPGSDVVFAPIQTNSYTLVLRRLSSHLPLGYNFTEDRLNACFPTPLAVYDLHPLTLHIV